MAQSAAAEGLVDDEVFHPRLSPRGRLRDAERGHSHAPLDVLHIVREEDEIGVGGFKQLLIVRPGDALARRELPEEEIDGAPVDGQRLRRHRDFCRVEILQQLCEGGEGRCHEAGIGVYFHQGFKDEFPFRHHGVRQREFGLLEIEVAILQQVDVDGAVVVSGIAFLRTPEFALYLLRDAENLVRLHVRLEESHGIEEHIVRLHIHGGRFIDGGALQQLPHALADELGGAADVLLALP